MQNNQPNFNEKLKNNQTSGNWLKATKRLYRRRSLILAALLFVLSLGLPSVVAQVSAQMPIVQSQPSGLQLVEQAKDSYETRDFAEAARIWQQAASTFAAAGDVLNQAMALSNLSLTYQQLAEWDKAKEASLQSLNLLQTQQNTPEKLRILAQSLDIQGKLQLEIGQSVEALETWQEATKIYTQIPNRDGVVQSQINQAQAMQDLGLYPRACDTLISALDIDIDKIGKTLQLNLQNCQSLTLLTNKQLESFTEQIESFLKTKPYSQLNFEGILSLGDVFKVVLGDLEKSQKILSVSQEVAERLNSPQNQATAYLSLGNTARAIAESADASTLDVDKYIEEASSYYNKSANLATSINSRILAQLNQLTILPKIQKWSEAQELWYSLKTDLNSLPPSRSGIYAQINFANNWIIQRKQKSLNPPADFQLPNVTEIEQILTNAVNQARNLVDNRAEAYALATTGFLYEFFYEQSNSLKDLLEALKYTKEALNINSRFEASDITYQLLWQLGRIYKAQQNIKDAHSAYTRAFNVLQSLRNDLLAANLTNQFYFRDTVEPIYRQLVELDLELARQETDNYEQNQTRLKQALQVIESLQLAELNNFFRSACLSASTQEINAIDKSAAVIYPIILKNRLEIILSLPGTNQPLRFYTPQQDNQPISKEQLESNIEEILGYLKTESNRSPDDFKRVSKQLYQWLIQPLKFDLTSSQIKTLVFVLDGKLRNIPMAALMDEEDKYLIKNYAIALTLGLQLLEPTSFENVQLKVFTAGLSKIRDNFPDHEGFNPLPSVPDGLKKIQALGISGEPLLDEEFTQEAVKNKIIDSPFPVVHLATHGKFAQTFEDTFLLTWDGRININRLNELLKSNALNKNKPIELLVLSACETASGDEQTALGLAGIAVRAGARSTIGTLWQVPDESSSELMVQFYSQLKKAKNMQVNKAEALRQAQVNLLENKKYEDPANWAAFVLLGNWL